MKKLLRFSLNLLRFICIVLIVWFLIYFLFGHRFSITFVDRDFAGKFPYILTFAAAASIYGLFVLAIKSSKKKWINILLFALGLIFATLPLIAYHGYFQNQCGIWNRNITGEGTLLINENNPVESIKIIQSVCTANQLEKVDTVYSQAITPCFELNHSVKLGKTEGTEWVKPK